MLRAENRAKKAELDDESRMLFIVDPLTGKIIDLVRREGVDRPSKASSKVAMRHTGANWSSSFVVILIFSLCFFKTFFLFETFCFHLYSEIR